MTLKLSKGNFSLELIFTKQKVKKLRGERDQEKKLENFYFFSFHGSPNR